MRINFYLDSRPNAKGEHPIIVAFSHQNKRMLTTVGYSIHPRKWDKTRQEVRKGSCNAEGWKWIKINSHLAMIRATMLDSAAKMDIITIEKLKYTFKCEFRNARKAAPEERSVAECMEEFLTEMSKENLWRPSTFQKFATLKRHLVSFRNPLSFKDIDENLLTDFVAFLREKKGNRNSTIGKSIDFLKWFLRWATKKKYNTDLAFQTFAPRLRQTAKKVIFLDWEELMRVYHYVLPSGKSHLAQVRDVFCFCCFTSLRYSDVANLKRDNVFKDYISITTVKTADSLTIDLNNFSRKILNKYRRQKFPNGLALPIISNQKMNEYLKELCRLAGINKPETITYYKGNQRIDKTCPKHELVGTHCGRRTFICNALMMGIPPQIVMKWTGHADYKAMQPYIDIADKNKAEAMQLFNR